MEECEVVLSRCSPRLVMADAASQYIKCALEFRLHTGAIVIATKARKVAIVELQAVASMKHACVEDMRIA